MIDRMLFAEALETQKCIDEGVLTTTADANIGSIMGIGFPPWTGGSAQYIVGYEGPSGIGKEAFVARAKELAERYGERFNPPAAGRLEVRQHCRLAGRATTGSASTMTAAGTAVARPT